jgi:hypothetical protein
LDGFIEFFGEDGSPEIARQIAASIEVGWTKNVRRRNGSIVAVKTNIHYMYTPDGERFRSSSYDQIRLYRGPSREESKINLADPVTGAPEATETSAPQYQRSIAGGVSVGRINLKEFYGFYPGVAIHEWGHALGFWYHIDNKLDHLFTPTETQIKEWAKRRPINLNPMKTLKIQPEDYLLSEDQVKWLIDVANKQAEDNPAYVAEEYEPPPP